MVRGQSNLHYSEFQGKRLSELHALYMGTDLFETHEGVRFSKIVFSPSGNRSLSFPTDQAKACPYAFSGLS